LQGFATYEGDPWRPEKLQFLAQDAASLLAQEWV